MNRNAIVLPLAALALAGCATKDPVTPAAPPPVVLTPPPAVVTAPAAVVTAPAPGTVVIPPTASAPVVVPTPTAVRAGHGRIESMTALPGSAAAGATTKPVRRFVIKMDDGTVQYVDTAAEGYSIGDRIELTSDGYIKRS